MEYKKDSSRIRGENTREMRIEVKHHLRELRIQASTIIISDQKEQTQKNEGG